MERIKSINWKLVVYWSLVFSVTNIYIVPKFVDHEPITSKKILIGVIISVVFGVIMGFIASKPNEEK